jgi:hypothetical protein
MKLYVVCDGADILKYGFASEKQIEGMKTVLKPGEALHEVQDDFLGTLSDETHQWDEATQSVVPK